MVGLPVEITPENKCRLCAGSKCCTYITQPLDTPRSKADFQLLLWQLSHAGIEIYKDDGQWHLLVNTPCTHLQSDGRCAIYEQRPSICREYDNEWCEYDAPAEEGFELHFRSYQELLKYCQKRFKHWDS